MMLGEPKTKISNGVQNSKQPSRVAEFKHLSRYQSDSNAHLFYTLFRTSLFIDAAV